MYCKHCGNEMHEQAAACVKCGFAKGTGNAFCPVCGQATAPGAAFCTTCGAGLQNAVIGEQKSKLAAGLLAIFMGFLGIHNFYLGYTGKAITQLLLTVVGSCVIVGPMVAFFWGIIDAAMIFAGKIDRDVKGVPLKD